MSHHYIKQFAAVCLLSLMAFSVMANGLQEFNGKADSLDSHTGKGKWTVVMIWASDCHVCNEEARQYEKFHQLHQNKDATVLGITLDGMANKQAAESFIKRHKVSFPNLIGEPEKFLPYYSQISGKPWIGTPTIMVYAPNGDLRGAQAGAIPVEIIEAFIKQESVANAKTGVENSPE